MGKVRGWWGAGWLLAVAAGATWAAPAQAQPARLVVDIFPGIDQNFMQPFTSNPTFLTNVNGVLFFNACSQGDFGTPADCELWRSDGSPGGTVRVKDIFTGGSGVNANSGSPANLINFNGTLLFTAGNAATGTQEPWISNGTDAGTVPKELVAGMNGSGGTAPFSVIGNYALFPARTGAFFAYELAKYDGNTSTLVKNDFTTNGADGILVTGAGPAFANLNGIAIFGAAANTLGQHYELWRSDGTNGATTLVRDIFTGGAPPNSSNPQWFTTVGNTVYFQATSDNGTELWRTNGLFFGTVIVKDLFPGTDINGFQNNGNPTNLVNFNGTLFFNGCDANGCELWRSDGTANGTVMVKDIFAGSQGNVPNSGSPFNLTVVGNTLFFAACDGNGCELWKSDGTTNGTVMVKDINGGAGSSNPFELTNVNGHLFFTADNGVNGRELWVSDGTDTGTRMVADLRAGMNVGSIDFGYLTNVNGTLFFVANDGTSGKELFRTFTNQLQVTKTGTGTGTVTSAPLGISCGGTCAFNFLDDFVITLTAVAAGDSTFTGWSGGGCSGTGLCQVTLSNATVVTANFSLLAPSTFSLTVVKAGSAPGSGTVTSSPAGINCGVVCNFVFNAGAQITLTAGVVGDATFGGWSGGGCSGTGTCQVTLNANTTVTATFDALPAGFFNLSVNRIGGGSGTVTSSPAGIDCGAACSLPFAGGTLITLTANPAPGSSFGGFSGGGCGNTNPCQLTLSASTTVTATFNLGAGTATLTVVRTGAGLVSSSLPGIACGGLCAQSFAGGTDVTLTALTAPGFVFGGFSGGGCGGTDACTVTLGSDTTVNATFDLVTPMVIQLVANGAAFSTGQLLSLTVVAANLGPAGVGDFFLGAVLPAAAGPALGCPAGDALVFFANGGASFVISCLSSPASTFPPFLPNVSVPGGLPPAVVPIFQLIWPAGAPPGPYTFFGVLTALSAFNSAALNFADVVATGLAGVSFTP